MVRSRLLMPTQESENTGGGDAIEVDGPAVMEGQLIPPTVPVLPPVDLGALAGQLPDLSNLDNLTVNIQANTFLAQ